LPDGVSFQSQEAAQLRLIYAPLCGTDSLGIKSAITPFLSGDIKIDRSRYLTKPTSREDLRQTVRNFSFYIEGRGAFSLTQRGEGVSSTVEVGQLWHKLTNVYHSLGLEVSARNFVPVSGESIELMWVNVRNTSSQPITMTPTISIPIFGRALANKHDHEHVTALLHRIEQITEGVVVHPTMIFNEEGHKDNPFVYFVLGCEDQGQPIRGAFPTVESFCGEEGTLEEPRSILENRSPQIFSHEALQGKEAMGALRFYDATLAPSEERGFLAIIGVVSSEDEARNIFKRFSNKEKIFQALEENQKYWQQKSGSIQVKTASPDYDSWVRWVTLQPVLRRIFGCSFLPDHDYGKGGKGWRDLWQDLLSLILIEPDMVRESLINNFAGVRIDGSNATIIGTVKNEFMADRNAITRVWMDHGAWPFLTILLYVHQTGDFDILFEDVPYFRDPQLSRSKAKDSQWSPEYGQKLKTTMDEIYEGNILEHILVQTLIPFFNVGEHNIIRLESADWNDGLDMAFERGESVAFSSLYAGNLLGLADLLEELRRGQGLTLLPLAKEVGGLLDTLLEEPCDYDSPEAKRSFLFEKYFPSVQPHVSGIKEEFAIEKVIEDLRRKGNWLLQHIQKNEKVSIRKDGENYQWFNGYYDNQSERVEGLKDNRVWMTLTGQVFAVMCGVADAKETEQVVKSVQAFLKDPQLGGYHLNTDFGVRHYLDLGRAFGFAYGTKENGAFFSHMTVMYAYGLYKRGFVKEGWEVLRSIYQMSTDTSKSKIYPGVPEYFDGEGRGMYGYLTGSASWYVLTLLTQIFGVRGEWGDLLLEPKLTREQFGASGKASVQCIFANCPVTVVYENSQNLEWGNYQISTVHVNGQPLGIEIQDPSRVRIPRSTFLKDGGPVELHVGLHQSKMSLGEKILSFFHRR
ncbi:MAG: hypothetical protein NUV91_04240, partial [Candidatus Omnitrophica bacterium]|nr:hypothetical protein [Candidatus Omnitrophota bacterium]